MFQVFLYGVIAEEGEAGDGWFPTTQLRTQRG